MSFIKPKTSELLTYIKVTRAEKLFGFDKNAPYGPRDVHERFAAAVKAVHPDSMGQGSEEPPVATLSELREAKDVLIAHLRW